MTSKIFRKPTLSLPPRLQAPKPWSHQTDLVALRGKKIEVLLGGSWLLVYLEEADQFTIKISMPHNRKSELTYFKHAISGYRPA